MKKTLKLALALLACVLMFTACDSGNELQTPSNATYTTHEHEFGEWKTVSKPTCKQEGTEARKCNICYETETRTTNKLEQHSTINGVCTFCGDFITSASSDTSLPETVMIKDFAADIYFEGDTTGYNPMYFKFSGKMYLRGKHNANFTGDDIIEQLSEHIKTSPKGIEGCVEIPHNYSLFIDLNNNLSIGETRNAQPDKYQIFKVSTGQSWGGIGQNIYLQETLKTQNPSGEIASYFANEVEDCVQKVREACTEKSLVFAVISDSHYSGSNNWENTIKNIQAVNDKIKFDGIYHLGDLIQGNLEKSVSLSLLSDMREELYNVNSESYIIPGNHDDNAWYDETNHTGLITKDDWYSILCRHKDVDVKRTGNNVYWYKDMPSFGVRVICLDSHLGEGTYGQGTSWGFPTEEVEWVRDVALNTQNKVIFFSHIPLTQEFNAYNANPENGAELSAIINTFIDEGGTVIGFFHGHTHWDYIGKKDTNSFYEVSIGASYTTTNYGTYKPDNAVVEDRAEGTLSEDLWDILIIQPESGTVKIIRFGAGEDREISFSASENSSADKPYSLAG